LHREDSTNCGARSPSLRSGQALRVRTAVPRFGCGSAALW